VNVWIFQDRTHYLINWIKVCIFCAKLRLAGDQMHNAIEESPAEANEHVPCVKITQAKPRIYLNQEFILTGGYSN
jgi:hypothetical protein